MKKLIQKILFYFGLIDYCYKHNKKMIRQGFDEFLVCQDCFLEEFEKVKGGGK